MAPDLEVVAKAVRPLPDKYAKLPSDPLTGKELYAAVCASAKIFRQSDSLDDETQRYLALDVQAWDKTAALLNPAWSRGLSDLEAECNSKLLESRRRIGGGGARGGGRPPFFRTDSANAESCVTHTMCSRVSAR